MSLGRFRPGDPAAAKYGRRCYGGWDLYVGDRQTRCLLRRPNRLPAGAPRGAHTLTQIIWPEPSLDDARSCLAAVMANDAAAMRAMKAMQPEHTFGFEELLEPHAVAPPRRFHLTRCSLGPVNVEAHAVVAAAVAWVELCVTRGALSLTRIRIDLDGSWRLVDHRPKRYLALGLQPNRWRRWLVMIVDRRAADEQAASSDDRYARGRVIDGAR